MRDDVDACDVHRTERRALRAADRWSGDRVRFLDRDVSPLDGTENLNGLEEGDAVADEVRRVPRRHDALAQAHFRERRDRANGGGIGLCRRDDLEQAEVARWIEEVRAEEVPAEALRSSFGDRTDRNARGIRADDGVRAAQRVDPREQRLFGVEPFDDRLDDPVGRAHEVEVFVEAAGPNQRREVGCEERVGLDRPRARQPFACRVARDVQQRDRNTGVREVRRHLCAHHTRAQHGGGANHHGHPLIYHGAVRGRPRARHSAFEFGQLDSKRHFFGFTSAFDLLSHSKQSGYSACKTAALLA